MQYNYISLLYTVHVQSGSCTAQFYSWVALWCCTVTTQLYISTETVQLHNTTAHCTATVTVIMYICTVELHYYSKFKFCISHESAPFNSPSFFTTDFHFRATKKLPMKKMTLLMMIMSAMMMIMMIIYITIWGSHPQKEKYNFLLYNRMMIVW